jgi:hypothetical protein
MSSAPSKRTVEVQDRDLEILRGLFESRVMTAEHVAAIHFEGRYEAARKRLQKLKTAGYVGERPRRAYDPAVLFLTKKAFALLCERGAIANYPKTTWKSLEKRVRVSPLTLRHELEVQDVKAAMVQAISQAPGLEVTEFNTWPLLNKFRAYTPAGELVTVKPDGLIRIRQSMLNGEILEHALFLEVDRSTETLETLAQRACCYRDYYRRGGWALRHGRPASEFEYFPFRVLLICKTAQRRNNVAERLLACRPPILTQACLATFPEVVEQPLGTIWVRPADYRDAISKAHFTAKTGREELYRHEVDRDRFFHERIVKDALLPPTLPA